MRMLTVAKDEREFNGRVTSEGVCLLASDGFRQCSQARESTRLKRLQYCGAKRYRYHGMYHIVQYSIMILLGCNRL